jgi:hypothetical protein
MPTTSFTSAEAVADKDGLIHGVSAEELQIIGEQCIEAKARAYCTYHSHVANKSQRGILTWTCRPLLPLPRWRIPSTPVQHVPRAKPLVHFVPILPCPDRREH